MIATTSAINNAAISMSPVFPAFWYSICSIICFCAVSSAFADSVSFKSMAASSALALVDDSDLLGLLFKYRRNSSRRALIP